MSNFIIDSKIIEAPPELQVTNFSDDAVVHFRGRKRHRPVNEIIVHETVTRSVEATVRVLQRRKLGAHFIIGPDGKITQHGDLATDTLWHAGVHNRSSVGIEITNPYYPKYLKPGLPWSTVIEARWPHGKQYVVPTLEQSEAVTQLIAWLTSDAAEGLDIPRTWRGLRGGKMSMGRTATGRLRRPGVYAHHYFKHADGAWPVLYAWLRLEAGLDADEAYAEAMNRATGAKRRIDLSDLMNGGHQ